jgi:hypothetical protein
MGRIQRLNNNIDTEASTEIELGDTVSVTFRDGTVAIFREPTAEDIITIRKSGAKDEMDVVARVANRCCIKWGERDSVALPTVMKLGVRDFKSLNDAIGSFLGGDSGI